jgi:hypothetical protein
MTVQIRLQKFTKSDENGEKSQKQLLKYEGSRIRAITKRATCIKIL